MNRPKWLVFDLGGVLADYIGPERLMSWMRREVAPGEFHRMWLYSPTVRAFESGRTNPAEFAATVIREFDFDVGEEAFLAEYPGLLTDWFDGAEELLTSLRARFPLALLSNTNPLHWERLASRPGCQRLFQKLLLSYETGRLKPDADAFLHAAEALGCAPHDLLFFDDNLNNVSGAQACGLGAVQVAGLADLKAKLAGLGL